MPPLSTLLHPAYPWRFLKTRIFRWWLNRYPNQRGVHLFPPGHFYSPLLDLETSPKDVDYLPHDGEESWEQVNLHPTDQRDLYLELLSSETRHPFPEKSAPGWLYHFQNGWFPLADAFLLSGLIQREKPQRIIEVGSGFSTAVMLDTLGRMNSQCSITCVEPYPERLEQLLGPQCIKKITLHRQIVQTLPLEQFDTLEAGDFLFIDSSHVAKVGSDVSFLLLRVIPRLNPGVWIHIHDMFFPVSYPMEWIKMGRAWNESLILRALLINNPTLKIRAFNSFAATRFPEVFEKQFPEFLNHGGGSFWMQRI
jgi:predicted O-methyltransferase YrrM